MTGAIDAQTVALSLMREALTMLDGEEAAETAGLLKRAIEAAGRRARGSSLRIL